MARDPLTTQQVRELQQYWTDALSVRRAKSLVENARAGLRDWLNKPTAAERENHSELMNVMGEINSRIYEGLDALGTPEAVEFGAQIETKMRETALRVIASEQQPGGSLYRIAHGDREDREAIVPDSDGELRVRPELLCDEFPVRRNPQKVSLRIDPDGRIEGFEYEPEVPPGTAQILTRYMRSIRLRVVSLACWLSGVLSRLRGRP